MANNRSSHGCYGEPNKSIHENRIVLVYKLVERLELSKESTKS